MAKRHPMGALGVLFAGFILLLLLSEVGDSLLARVLLSYSSTSASESSVIKAVQGVSTELALSAAILGIAFEIAVLFTSRRRLASELRIYRLMGLPVTSALRLVLASQPVLPVTYAVVAGSACVLLDIGLGFDAWTTIWLVSAFLGTLVVWLVAFTAFTFLRRELSATTRGGRTG